MGSQRPRNTSNSDTTTRKGRAAPTAGTVYETPHRSSPGDGSLEAFARLSGTGTGSSAVTRPTDAIAELSGTGGSTSGNYNYDPDRPAGEQIPDSPTSATPGAVQSPISGNPDQTQAGNAQDLIDASHQGDINELDAADRNREQALDVRDDINTTIDETTGEIDDVRTELEARQDEFDRRMGEAEANIAGMPTEVANKFDQLKEEFTADVDASFGRIDDQREAALGKVNEGRAMAMQAAVVGIQGNVNSSIAQIQSNPNLSQAQKASMIAQTRLTGASALVPAIGATIAEFNKMGADIATSFGSYTASLEGVGLQGKGAIATAHGTAFAETTVAAREMTGQLLQITANSDAAYANTQSTLLATRSNVQLTGQQLQSELLPELYVPWYDPSGTAQLVYETNQDIAYRDWEMNAGEFSMGLNLAVLREQQGTPGGNIVEAATGGYLNGGGWVGGLFAGLGQLWDNIWGSGSTPAF